MTDESPGRGAKRRDLLKLLGIAPVVGYVASDAVAATSRQELDEPPGSLVGTSISVALGGDTALVGTPASWSADGDDVGSVTVYGREAEGWERQASLTSAFERPHFGSTVALDGETALVGDPLPTVAGTSREGEVAVFRAHGESWERATTLTRSAAAGVDRFGGAVALDGSTALVGASTATTDRGFRSGAASVFSRAGGSWDRQATLRPEPGGDRFGTAVALDGETAAVGARRRGESPPVPAGEVCLFERSGEQWSRSTTLRSPRPGPDDEFGAALALDGDTLLVGAPMESNATGDNAGAVHVFTRTGGRWRHRQTVLASDGAPDDQFGRTLALDGDVAVVGRRARASPSLLTRKEGRWCERDGTTDGGPGRTRTAVALAGKHVLVGVAGSRDSTAGSVTVFDA